jgi:hypothetical protein
LALTTGLQPLSRWAWGPLSVPYRPCTLAYKLQVNTKSRECIHAPPRALQLWTLPSYQGGLRRCHVSHSTEPHLPIREGSSAAMWPMALDLASLLGRAPVLPRVLLLQTSPPSRGGLRCYNVSHGSGPCLPTGEGSSVATCPIAPDPTSLTRRALVLSRVL